MPWQDIEIHSFRVVVVWDSLEMGARAADMSR
jgi:hypothetical protein